jgi:hypothetical protein
MIEPLSSELFFRDQKTARAILWNDLIGRRGLKERFYVIQ